MCVSMSRSSTWLSALAPPQASASPPSVASARPAGGHPAGADDQPAGAGDQEEHHDPRLRQRHVVPPRGTRHRRALRGTRSPRTGPPRRALPRRDATWSQARRPGERGQPGGGEEEERPPRRPRAAPGGPGARGARSGPWLRGAPASRVRRRRGRAPRSRSRRPRPRRPCRRARVRRSQGPGCVRHVLELPELEPQVAERARARDVGHPVEVVRRRRRGRVPLERVPRPGIVADALTAAPALRCVPDEDEERDAHEERAQRRDQVVPLEEPLALVRVDPPAASPSARACAGAGRPR